MFFFSSEMLDSNSKTMFKDFQFSVVDKACFKTCTIMLHRVRDPIRAEYYFVQITFVCACFLRIWQVSLPHMLMLTYNAGRSTFLLYHHQLPRLDTMLFNKICHSLKLIKKVKKNSSLPGPGIYQVQAQLKILIYCDLEI